MGYKYDGQYMTYWDPRSMSNSSISGKIYTFSVRFQIPDLGAGFGTFSEILEMP